MAIHPLVQTQLEHNLWATRRVLAACGKLSAEQFGRELGVGPGGGLRGTLEHIIEVMFFFADNFAGREYRRREDFDEKSKTVEGLSELLERAGAELAGAIGGCRSLAEDACAEVAWATSPTGRLPVTEALAQVFDHGSHHRAQCINMLKRLGVTPLPDIDPLSRYEERVTAAAGEAGGAGVVKVGGAGAVGGAAAAHPTGDVLDVLLRHNAWATNRLIETCATLTGEQFHQRFELGPGSLHDTLAHIIGAMFRWADRISLRPPRPSIERPTPPETERPRRSPEELAGLLRQADADLRSAATIARERGLSSLITVEFPSPAGKVEAYTFTRGAALAHVATHGAHHRAQCLNMLRRLGMDPEKLPEIDVVEWQAVEETAVMKRPAGGA